MVLQVRAGGANGEASRGDLELLRENQYVIASCDPLSEPQAMAEIAKRKVLVFATRYITSHDYLAIAVMRADMRQDPRDSRPGAARLRFKSTQLVRWPASR